MVDESQLLTIICFLTNVDTWPVNSFPTSGNFKVLSPAGNLCKQFGPGSKVFDTGGFPEIIFLKMLVSVIMFVCLSVNFFFSIRFLSNYLG